MDGTSLAKQIYIALKEEVSDMQERPRMAIVLVGKNSPSLRYIKQKRKWAEYIGYGFQLFEYPMDVEEHTIIAKIHELNQDTKVHGIMIQTPLPGQVRTRVIIDTIDPNKDIDGFHASNQGKVLIGDMSGLMACTPLGIMEIFRHYAIDISGKHVVIIGRSNIVGKPMANMCISAGATVTVCHSQTPDISVFTRQADVLIVATGQPKLIQKDMVKSHTIIIDVGFSVVNGKILGDTEFEALEPQHMITPTPGGVGPMTVAVLMQNLLKSYKIQKSI